MPLLVKHSLLLRSIAANAAANGGDSPLDPPAPQDADSAEERARQFEQWAATRATVVTPPLPDLSPEVQREPNQRAIGLLDHWLAEDTAPDADPGGDLEIHPLSAGTPTSPGLRADARKADVATASEGALTSPRELRAQRVAEAVVRNLNHNVRNKSTT